MALTSTTVLDLTGLTSSLSYYQGASLTDQITFSSNSITFASNAGFNLSKSDMLLYNTFFQTWFTSLIINFPSIQTSFILPLPLSLFTTSITSAGVTHINYIQTSGGSVVQTINYVPSAVAGSIAARSTITITLQELFAMQSKLLLFANQVALN